MDERRESESGWVKVLSRRGKRVAIRDRKLYLCLQEETYPNSCYSIRAFNLKHLMDCSCCFDAKIGKIINCASCERVADGYDIQAVGSLCGIVVPKGMSSCLFGSQIIFLGGRVFPWLFPNYIRFGQGFPLCPEPSKKVFVYDISPDGDQEDEDGRKGYPDNNIRELDEKNSLTRYKHELHYPRMVEFRGDLYALGFCSSRGHHVLYSEVYRRQSQQWEDMPEPPMESFSRDNTDDTVFSYLFTDDRIFVSKKGPDTPVQCYNVGHGCWITSRCFNSEPFPFDWWGLVVDNMPSGDKLVFSFNDINRDIIVWRLVLTDEVDDSHLKNVGSVKTASLLHRLLKGCDVLSQNCFLNLGDGKICFVMLKNHPHPDRDNGPKQLEKVSVILIVFKYEFNPKTQSFSSKFVSTRTFSFIPHCERSSFVRLLNSCVC